VDVLGRNTGCTVSSRSGVTGLNVGSAVRGLTLVGGTVRLVCDAFLNKAMGRRGDADRARDSVSGF
jgi:hypothetical protein